MDTTPYLLMEYTGLGCWNLVREVYRREYDIELRDYDHLTKYDSISATLDSNRTSWWWPKKGEEREGDLVLFTLSGRFYHVGVVLPNKMFIHVRRKKTFGVVERYDSPEWRNIVEGFYRHEQLCP